MKDARWAPVRLVRHDAAGPIVRVVVAAVLAISGVGCAEPSPDGAGRPAQQSVKAPAGDARRGLALLTAFRDSLPAHSGNALRCTSCHLDNGARDNAMPWFGTAARYPKYRSRRGSEENLAQRVNECIARSLAGQVIPVDGQDMHDMVAYIETLRDIPRPAGPDTVRLVGDTARGHSVYGASCARCHGATGEGGSAPAVAGAASYSVGAGLARQKVLATFVHANMPYDSAGSTSPQRSADVAAYVLALPRQDHPGKERDWPKGDPPADVAYATDSARRGGKPMPPARPLLPRRIPPTSAEAPGSDR